ncbi:MAG: PAS domain S-box protein [Bacteroidales bacterium]|jgi:PAS domain S-box-containing protein|nr:PAS domain S-box protein [Bacteroidales bacterium]
MPSRLFKKSPDEEIKLKKILQERIKELQCLYQIANLSEESGISKDRFLQKTVEILPQAWQYPEITCARITFNNNTYKTSTFKETKWSQTADLYTHHKNNGIIEVYYLKEKPRADEGPFLKEERELINTIAKNISTYLDRKQIEQEKAESEENLRITLNSIGDAVIATDVQGKISHLNPVAEKLTGWNFEEARDQPIHKIFHIINAQTREQIENPVKKVLKTGEVIGLANHTKLISKDGKEYHIADSGSPILNSKKETVGVVLVFRNVTEEFEMVEQLKESEEKYRTIFENTGTSTCILEKDGTISMANSKFAQLAGYPIQEIEQKKTWMEFVVPNDLERMSQQHELRRKNRLEALTEYEFHFIDKNKQIKNIYLTIDMIPGTDKSVASLLDVTEKRKTEKKIKWFGKIIEESFNEVYLFDPKTLKIKQTNKTAVNNTGYSSEEVLMLTPLDLKPHISKEKFNRLLSPLLSKEKQKVVFETIHQRKNGTTYNVEVHIQLIDTEPGPLFVAIILDISDRKGAEQKLKQSERNYRLLVENQTDLIVKVDPEGRFLFVSPSYCELFGKTREELLGKVFLPLVHEDDREPTTEAMKKLYEPPHKTYLEQRAFTSQGWMWLAWNDTAVLDDDGNVREIIGVGRNINDQKIAELDLKNKINELERLNRVMIGRENKMIELKKEVNELREQLNQPPKYNAPEVIKKNNP